ncbi:hypothetical protein [Duganella radicis]|uniref:Uncharacterized protein n=1 Tax=Duganella radicis TaxID=551988 RepID=A0A6L6PCI9_9BURK|nr:hypothetical protein [Duganella radicis]MTV36788.1 hypothetical protein [Duganella radicis]
MKRVLAAFVASHAFAAASLATEPPVLGAQPQPAGDLAQGASPAAPVLTDEIIRKAVRDTIAEDPHPAPAGDRQDGVLRANTAHARMTAAFNDAKVPDCLHDDALKLQPAHIGPIGVVGPLSLPWIIAAAVRGKCN